MEEAASRKQKTTDITPRQCPALQFYLWGDTRSSSRSSSISVKVQRRRITQEKPDSRNKHSTSPNSQLVLPLQRGYSNTKGCIMLNYSMTLARQLYIAPHGLFSCPLQSYFAELEKGRILWSRSDTVDSLLVVISSEARWKRTQGTRTVLTAQGSHLPEERTWQLPPYFLLQTKWKCNMQNTAGENRVFATPWGHPPAVSVEVTVHMDPISNLHLLVILLLSISMLIFTHFSPNYCYFSKQYIVYITTRGKKRKQVLVNHLKYAIVYVNGSW